MKTQKGFICSAEIGRAGNMHMCGKKAHHKARGKFGIVLHYCDAHKDRRDSKPLTEGDYIR